MRKHWSNVRLGEVLTPVERSEAVDPTKEYPLLGVRLDARGPFLRETILGSQSAAIKLFRVASGDFIYSRLFACRGAFGVIGPEFDGCYVSGEFPTFLADAERLDVRFVRHWFRLPMTLARVDEDCTGSTPLTRNRFKEQFFLALEIPLPPLAEQQRIVARIEELATQIQQAYALRYQAAEETESLIVAMAYRLDLSESEKLKTGWVRRKLRECIQFVDDSYHVEAHRSYPNFGIYSFGRGLFPKPPIDGALTAAITLRRVRSGQFIYSRLFAFEGAFGMLTEKFDGHFVSGEYPTFDCRPGIIRGEFLTSYFKAPSAWRAVAVGSKGLGDRRQRVHPNQLLENSLWVPPIDYQNRLVEVQAEVDALKGMIRVHG